MHNSRRCNDARESGGSSPKPGEYSHVTDSPAASHDYRNGSLIERAREKPIDRRRDREPDAFRVNSETGKAIGSSR